MSGFIFKLAEWREKTLSAAKTGLFGKFSLLISTFIGANRGFLCIFSYKISKNKKRKKNSIFIRFSVYTIYRWWYLLKHNILGFCESIYFQGKKWYLNSHFFVKLHKELQRNYRKRPIYYRFVTFCDGFFDKSLVLLLNKKLIFKVD